MVRAIHHWDLWVSDPGVAVDEWGWLLGELGWELDSGEGAGASWAHPDGTYLFETATLRESMRDLRDAERGLDAELPTIRSLRLPAPAVGDVDGAGTFATEVNSYFDDTATRLRHSTDAVGVSATGLAEVADTYDETDHDSRDRFHSALDGML